MTYYTPPKLEPIPDQIVKGKDGHGVLMLDGVVYEVFLPPVAPTNATNAKDDQ